MNSNSFNSSQQIKRKLSDIGVNLPNKKSIKIESSELEFSQFSTLEDDKENILQSSQTDSNLDSILSQSSFIKVNEIKQTESKEETNNTYSQHYSITVFEENVKTVLEQEAFLFLEDELNWWNSYLALKENSKSLFVRIYIRKFGWLRQAQLTQYFLNTQDLLDSIKDLHSNKLIQSAGEDDSGVPLEEILNQLMMPEIKQISKTLKFKKIKMNSTKAQFISAILESIQSQPSLFQMNFFKKSNTNKANSLESKLIKDCLKFTGQMVKVNEGAWKFFNLVNRVFTRFGDADGQHVMSTSVRAKIGLLQYMDYQITRSNQVFCSRKCLLEYEEAWNNFQVINEYFHTGSPSQTHFQAICELCAPIHESWKTLLKRDYSTYSTNYFLKFTPGMVYTRVMTLYAASLSRLKKYKEEELVLLDLLGQDIFRQNKRGVWWTRLCLVQATHLSKSDDAYLQIAYESCVKALEEKINNGIDSGSANAIYHRMVKLESKLKLEDDKKCKIKDPRPPIAPVITLYGSRVEASGYGEGFKPLWRIVESDELVSVEQFALHTLTKDGWKGYHSENSILTTLFALLFVDILFSPKPGAFETRFQLSPLDLGSEAFYIDRKKEIESRFESIRNGEFESLITKHYEDNYAKKPSILGLNWQFELKDVIELSKCIGGESLSHICLPFCKDYFSYSSGMPDLCIWNTESNQCKFIEVKGPNDRLSEKQKNWLDYLTQSHVQVQVCYVKDDVVILDSDSD